MRFELYAYNNSEDNNFRTVLFANDLGDVRYHIKRFPLPVTERYIVLDNVTPHPLNYTDLGFSAPPGETECYTLIYNCKVVKYTAFSLPEENFVRFYGFAMDLALYETLMFFRKK